MAAAEPRPAAQPEDHPAWPVLQAPSSWQIAEFISDLHLQAGEPATFDAWRRYLQATTADAVFILGDLFEVWVGDDAAAEPGFAADCAAVLRSAAQRRPLFFMHGNRDFLVGPRLMQSCGATLLGDPTVLVFAGRRWLLTHGDALCLGDADYLRVRKQLRAPAWQQAFLARPLGERIAIAKAARHHSEVRKQSDPATTDVDSSAARAWLDAAGAEVMVHGHTHKPADHALGQRKYRVVLSDWDAAATPPRAEVLRLTPAGWQRAALA
jgi:UDP-2,3-diacylglucosamine hydrolase